MLADEVVVMTARPGRVKDVVPVDLPRPRTTSDIAKPAFGKLYEQIYGLIRDEVEKSMDRERQQVGA